MAVDLNHPSPDDGETLPDLNQPQLEEEEDPFQNYDAHQGDVVGVQITGGKKQRISPDGEGEAILDLNLQPAHQEEYFHDVLVGDHICTQEEQGNNPDGNVNFEGHDDPAHLNLHAFHQPDEDLLYDNYIAAMEEMHEYGVYANDVDIIFSEEEVDITFDVEELSDSGNEDDAHANATVGTRSKDLTATQRQQIYEALLEKSVRGKLKRYTTTEVAELFNVHRATVWRIWRQAKQCRDNGVPVDVSSRKPKNCGRKKVQLDMSQVESIPLRKRCTIRSLAEALGMKKTTVHRIFKDGLIRRHSSSLKPYLKEANKKERLRWCVSMLNQLTLDNEPKFIEMDNRIHMDEKWFNATRKNVTYYMTHDEEDPHRTVTNKNYIEKVMFLSAVANPHYDAEGNCIFDGKIGIWPFIRREPAQRKSDNRPRGTLISKTMKVDRNTSRAYLISKVLPAIKACWPQNQRHKTIWIQQDNARTHVPVNDEQFALAVDQTGLDIRLVNQPPNSPDMNVLDLGFFASLQSLTYTTTSKNMDELIANVQKKYENYNPKSLRNVFLTLQGCMIEVMKVGGGNKYKIPHMNKDGLEAQDILPTSLSCDRELYESVMESITS